VKINDERVAMTSNPQIAGYDECSFDNGVSEAEQEVELAIQEATTLRQDRKEESTWK
jgi:hypothetical protein